ncbi:Elongation of very long chain fatty acids protein 6 [Melipona quadrifasciata]|uniref:Elongation of very long chain fatty acids protein n=1 Tax=Melipona quadrifasciata TaxID=166423 RepID=A0A0N0U5H1_9HYME|nr:Elongation of very long chain fatty acids protein 6 [Melipona quadrifasciata]
MNKVHDIQVTVPNYSHVFNVEKTYFYPDNQAWLTNNFPYCFYCCGIYVILIFGGKCYMSNRPKFNLRGPLALWSALLATFSIIGFSRTAPELFHILEQYGFYHSVCTPRKGLGTFSSTQQLSSACHLFSRKLDLGLGNVYFSLPGLALENIKGMVVFVCMCMNDECFARMRNQQNSFGSRIDSELEAEGKPERLLGSPSFGYGKSRVQGGARRRWPGFLTCSGKVGAMHQSTVDCLVFSEYVSHVAKVSGDAGLLRCKTMLFHCSGLGFLNYEFRTLTSASRKLALSIEVLAIFKQSVDTARGWGGGPVQPSG